MFRQLLNLFGVSPPSLVPPPAGAPNVKHATREGTGRKRWRQMSRSRGGPLFGFGKHPPLHQQPEWLEHCARRVYRWFKHHDPRKQQPPTHIKRMMGDLQAASGRDHVERLVAHAARFRSYGH